MKIITLPERGLTLLPPWPQAIAFSSKRLENRGYGVARQLGSWRGLIGLSQSLGGISKDRTKIDLDVVNQAKDIARAHGWTVVPKDGRITPSMLKMGAWAGHLVLIAELVDVLPPEKCDGAAWHVPGQWGLILGQVWEVEPIPCTGGVGAWSARWCAICGRIAADTSRPACASCKGPIGTTGARPELRVIRECLA